MTPKNKRIRIGIYGAAGTGKTAFVYRFMKEIAEKQTGRFNKIGQNFFAEISRQIEKGEIKETSGFIDRIVVAVPNRLGERLFVPSLPDQIILNLEFYDANGKDLSNDLDSLGVENGSPASGLLARQIEKRDAFLFLVSPFSDQSENENEHLRREEIRVGKFIRETVTRRGNDYLPILFVQTHNDQMENTSPDFRRRADQWFDTVYRELNRQYRIFNGQIPVSLTSPEKIFCRTSAVDDFDKVFVPLARLLTIEQECDLTIRRDQCVVERWMTLTILLIFLTAAGFFLLWQKDKELPPTPVPVSETKELTEILLKMPADFLDRPDYRTVLKKAWIELKKVSQTDTSPKETEDLLAALNMNFEKISGALSSESLPNQFKAAELISDLLSAGEDPILKTLHFDKIRQQVRELGQNYALEQIQTVAFRNISAKSQPRDTLRELLETLAQIENRLGRTGIVSGELPDPLIESIRLLSSFLKARERSLNYETIFEVNGFCELEAVWAFRLLDQIESDSIQVRSEISDKNNKYPLKIDRTARTLPIKAGLEELDIRRWDREKREWQILDFNKKIKTDTMNLGFLGMDLLMPEEETVNVTIPLENGKKCELSVRVLPNYQESLRILWQALRLQKKSGV